MSNSIQPNRSQSPSTERKEPIQAPRNDVQERSSSLAQEVLRGAQPQQVALSLGDSVEEIHLKPLSLQEILDLPKETIVRLSKEQIAGAAQFIKENSFGLSAYFASNLHLASEELEEKLFALSNNPYIEQDKHLTETIFNALLFILH